MNTLSEAFPAFSCESYPTPGWHVPLLQNVWSRNQSLGITCTYLLADCYSLKKKTADTNNSGPQCQLAIWLMADVFLIRLPGMFLHKNSVSWCKFYEFFFFGHKNCSSVEKKKKKLKKQKKI